MPGAAGPVRRRGAGRSRRDRGGHRRGAHAAGVAASLLELRYSVGKNAAAGGDAAARRIVDLRGRIADRAAELVRLDGEIAALVAGTCGDAED